MNGFLERFTVSYRYGEPFILCKREEVRIWTGNTFRSVKPLTDHVLQVDFISGSRLLLDMKPYLDKFRFRSLSDPQVWNSAVTNGIFVRFGDVEMSHNELFSMAEQEH